MRQQTQEILLWNIVNKNNSTSNNNNNNILNGICYAEVFKLFLSLLLMDQIYGIPATEKAMRRIGYGLHIYLLSQQHTNGFICVLCCAELIDGDKNNLFFFIHSKGFSGIAGCRKRSKDGRHERDVRASHLFLPGLIKLTIWGIRELLEESKVLLFMYGVLASQCNLV